MLNYLLSFILMLLTILFLNIIYLHYRKWEKQAHTRFWFVAAFALFLLFVEGSLERHGCLSF